MYCKITSPAKATLGVAGGPQALTCLHIVANITWNTRIVVL